MSEANRINRERSDSNVIANDAVRLRLTASYGAYNPVKHGHAPTAAAGPYSSFHAFVAKGVYARDWGGPPDTANIRMPE